MGDRQRRAEQGATAPEELAGREETITFSKPRELRERVIVSE